ncbi:flavodoxin domain-containing protein [Mesobacillus campisalis]|nr:flavodoxin domain-containing protein [Mesobacillus campisalis]
MDSMSCNGIRAGIVYASITGNTRELAEIIADGFRKHKIEPAFCHAGSFPAWQLGELDLLAVVTYTWGNGEIPSEMKPVYEAIASQAPKQLITGAAGSGDSFYPAYCGAVDKFRDLLFVHTQLAVTLKVELMPQESDRERCQRFTDILVNRCLASAAT